MVVSIFCQSSKVGRFNSRRYSLVFSIGSAGTLVTQSVAGGMVKSSHTICRRNWKQSVDQMLFYFRTPQSLIKFCANFVKKMNQL